MFKYGDNRNCVCIFHWEEYGVFAETIYQDEDIFVSRFFAFGQWSNNICVNYLEISCGLVVLQHALWALVWVFAEPARVTAITV
jgi:hypothetical protein